jgi:hypothetical protein
MRKTLVKHDMLKAQNAELKRAHDEEKEELLELVLCPLFLKMFTAERKIRVLVSTVGRSPH